jgi:putative hydrolase
VPGSGPPGEPPDGGDDPFGSGGGPFGGIPLFGDLARLVQQQGPVSWDAARQLAMSIALGGESEVNVDPLERIQLEQLARVAELHVAGATGLSPSPTGQGIRIVPVNRTTWVQRSLDAYRPWFEQLAHGLSTSAGAATATDVGDLGAFGPDPDSGASPDAMNAWFGGLLQLLAPMMLGMTAGSMLGHLARRAFGQYDMPLPRPLGDELLLVVPNLVEFGEAWSLPADDLRLWVCIHEVAHHTVLNVPHVRARLTSLVTEFLGGFEPSATSLEDRLADIDIADPQSLQSLQKLFGDPEVILGAIRSDTQRALLPLLEALVAVVVGYVDHVMDTIGHGLIGSYSMLTEALRRRRVTADPSDRFVEQLFGLELSQAQYDRGQAFVRGVVERAGTEGLDRLWRSEQELPTPAEVDAPGLWLARIDLPE